VTESLTLRNRQLVSIFHFMYNFIPILKSIKNYLEEFKTISGYDLLSTNHPFAKQCSKCLDSPTLCTKDELITCSARLVLFVTHIKKIDPKNRTLILNKLRKNQQQADLRGIFAETFVAAQLKTFKINFDWSQRNADPDFSILGNPKPLCIEVTSVESNKEILTIEDAVRNLKQKISVKDSKNYSSQSTALVIDITNYNKYIILDNPNPEYNLIDYIDVSDYKFGAIITITSLVRAKYSGFFILGRPAPSGYGVSTGWNIKYDKKCDQALRGVLESIFHSSENERHFFSDIPKF
jgi:hypothetical protein